MRSSKRWQGQDEEQRWVSQPRPDGNGIEMDTREIARHLGVTHQAVNQCIQRAVRSIWRRQVSKVYAATVEERVRLLRESR